MDYYPVNLNISGRPCVVVGGGAVAWRKIVSLLSYGTEIKVISPVVCESIECAARSGQLQWLERKYRDSDIKGAFMVFAATDDYETQQQIVARAKKQGVLINCADLPDQCDFHVPAKIKRGALMISVSTGGGSPALSAQIKLRLLEEYGPEYAMLVDLMSVIRRHVVGKGLPEDNNKLFYQVLALPLPELIREKNWKRIEELLTKVLPATICSETLVAETRSRMPRDTQRYPSEPR